MIEFKLAQKTTQSQIAFTIDWKDLNSNRPSLKKRKF